MTNAFDQILNKTTLTQQEKDIFLLLSEHIQSGVITPQIPMFDLTSHNGLTPLYSNMVTLKTLFNNGDVVWQTNKGLISDYECRNPTSNRKISGVLFMSPDYMKKHIDLLFDISCKGILINNSTPYTRDEFDSILGHNGGKQYDFANVLPKKKTRKLI